MGQSSRKPHNHSTHSITYSKVVDLSLGIHPGMPLWPGDPSVEFDVAARLDSEGYFLRRFAMSEHGGTHINAPNSFHAGGASIDQYPAESLVVQASVISVLELVADHPDYQLTITDVERWEGLHGEVKPGSIALLHTGLANRRKRNRREPERCRAPWAKLSRFWSRRSPLLIEREGCLGPWDRWPGRGGGKRYCLLC